MPVYPQYTPGLGEALQGAMSAYLETKYRKAGLAMQQQQAADAHRAAGDTHVGSEISNAVNYNYMPAGSSVPDYGPPAESPAPALPSSSSPPVVPLTPDAISQAFAQPPAAVRTPDAKSNPLPSPLPSPGPSPASGSRAGAGALNIPGHPAAGSAPGAASSDPGGDFQANFARFIGPTAATSATPTAPSSPSASSASSPLSGSGLPSTRVTLDNGATIDPFAGFARQLFLLERQKQIEAQNTVDIANRTGVTDRNTAQAYSATREANQPKPGDPGYAEYQAYVAATKASALSPITTRTAANTERALAPIKTAQALDEYNTERPGRLADNEAVAAVRAGMAPRVVAANAAAPQLASAAETLQKYNDIGAAGRMFGRTALGGYTMSPEGQIAKQAAEQFAQAYLSGRTGRGASASQVAGLVNQILVQPGEENNSAVVAAKKQRVLDMQRELAQMGRAGQPATGAPPNSGDINLGDQGANPFASLIPKRGKQP